MAQAKTASSNTRANTAGAGRRASAAKRPAAAAVKRPATSAAKTGNASRAAKTAQDGAGAKSTVTAKRPSPAERAVLIPVGAALIARERVLAGVNDTLDTYSTPSKAGEQLRKFERRGHTARNRVEREVRKTRVRLERELRRNRTRLDREVRRRRREGEELADRVQERILSLV